MTIDEANVVRYANDVVEELFGYTADELEGESLDGMDDAIEAVLALVDRTATPEARSVPPGTVAE